MVVTVQDIMGLSVFDSIWLAAPCESYLSRSVINVATLDHEPFTGAYDYFKPGEFVFTSLGFAEQNPDLADEALIQLIDRDVAAIAIKPVALKSISQRVAEVSARKHVPIFFYTGRLLERVIVEAMTLIDADQADYERTRVIDRILAPSDEGDVRASMFAIGQLTGATVQCFAATSVSDDRLALQALYDQLVAMMADYETRWDDVEKTFVGFYRGSLLGFISFKRPPQSVITISEADLDLCIGRLGPLRCGIGQEVPLGQGDLTIRQARAALTLAQEREAVTLRWSAMGIEAFRVAARTDRLFNQTAAFNVARLAEYDAKHGSDLSETARVFAESYGEVTTTANCLFQHRNTIHYRLRKIKEVLGFTELSDHELAFFLMMIYV